jgi:3-methylfumaryl-CoA hydratase
MGVNIEELKRWIGRTETLTDRVTVAPLRALNATLDREAWEPSSTDAVPPCWHWLYFLPTRRQSDIDVDGHPQRGGFLPPVPLPRRMWAGSRIEFPQPIRLDDAITKTSRIVEVSGKEGRSGPLVFVRARHEISTERGVAIVEDQDIVYRDLPRPHAAAPVLPPLPADPIDEQFGRDITPDPMLLFRYSALTFNAHRIHYDRPYATVEEGYPGLVVHGPLVATLLIGELTRRHPDVRVTAFSFKALSPLFDTEPFRVCGRLDEGSATLWARGLDGRMAMQAQATVNRDRLR